MSLSLYFSYQVNLVSKFCFQVDFFPKMLNFHFFESVPFSSSKIKFSSLIIGSKFMKSCASRIIFAGLVINSSPFIIIICSFLKPISSHSLIWTQYKPFEIIDASGV